VAWEPIDESRQSLADIVDAATVVGLLVGKDGGPSLVEQLEFPKPKEKGEPLPDGVDATAHLTAALATYMDGDIGKAIDVLATTPHRELLSVLSEATRINKEANARSKAERPPTPQQMARGDDLKLSDEEYRELAEAFAAEHLSVIASQATVAQ